MKSIHANVTLDPVQDRRATRRWQVDLPVALSPGHGACQARIRNLSEAGMMLETDSELGVGDILTIELGEGNSAQASVVWAKGGTFGCRFLAEIPTSLVSALILQAPLEPAGEAVTEPRFEEIPVGLRPTFGEIAAWKSDFERRHVGSEVRLMGFRQTEGGLLIAIVSAD